MPIHPAPLSSISHAPSASHEEQTFGEMLRSIPGWVHVVGGGVVAAIIGAMMGGALHI